MWMGLDADRSLAHSSYQLSRNTADWMDDETAPLAPVGHPGHPRRGRRGDPGQHRRVRRRQRGHGRQLRPGHAAPRLLPQHHPRAGDRRRREGHLRGEARRRRQAGDRRPSTPARPPSRRSSPARSTPPTSVRTRRSTPSPSPRARPSGSSPAPPPAASRSWSSPASHGAQDLKGKKIATPQLGNTQDVAIRYWLKQKGLTTTKEGGGDVKIVPQENAQTVETFNSGAIDGAWVPEPFASRLVNAGGKVLVDERDLWPDKKFVITHLHRAARSSSRHTRTWCRSSSRARWRRTSSSTPSPTRRSRPSPTRIGKITGKPLDLKLIKQAWPTLEFTNDPIASSLKAGPTTPSTSGLTEPVDLKGIYDLKSQRGAQGAGQAGGRSSR